MVSLAIFEHYRTEDRTFSPKTKKKAKQKKNKQKKKQTRGSSYHLIVIRIIALCYHGVLLTDNFTISDIVLAFVVKENIF